MSYQQQLPGSQSYGHGGERNVYWCVAGAVEQIIPDAVVFPPQEGPTLNVNQGMRFKKISHFFSFNIPFNFSTHFDEL